MTNVFAINMDLDYDYGYLVVLLSCYDYVLSIMNEKCMRKIWFLSFASKIVSDYQIARVFNIEFLLDGLIVYFIFCMI